MRSKVIEKGTAIRKEKIQIDGKMELREIYLVDINTLYYNDENGRIATYIAEYNGENPKKISDLDFDEYNDTIMKYIKKSGTKNKYQTTKNDIARDGQKKAGIILEDGRIIDGNRRFTCLRELYKETNNEKYKYFECFILPTPKTAHDRTVIKTLELKYQFGEDQREDYNPIDKLVHIYSCLIEEPIMFTPAEYRDRVNNQITIADIKTAMTKAEIMCEYLEFINKPKRYDIARDKKIDGPIQEIASLKKKIKDKYTWSEVSSVLYSRLRDYNSGDTTRLMRELIKMYLKNPAAFEEVKKEVLMCEMKREEVVLYKQTTGVVNESKLEEYKKQQENLNRNISSAVEKTKRNEAKQKQAEIAKNANKKLREIDLQELKYISDDLKKEIKNELENMKKYISQIEGVINVK